MSALREYARRLVSLFRSDRLDREMAEELRAHLDRETEQNVARGMSPQDACYAALRAFGGVEQIKERARDGRAGRAAQDVLRDVGFALRSLRRAPGFTALVVLTLTLGIAATTAIFSLVDGLLLRPLPFADQASVVMIREATPHSRSSSVAYPNFVDWRERQRSFTELGAVRMEDVNITTRGDAERVSGAMVSHGFFAALGIQPVQGRAFDAADDRPGAPRTVLIRESLCGRRFGSATNALNQTLPLDGEAYTVIGVVSDAFVFPANATEVWLPLGLWANDYRNRREHPGISVVGRLRDGVTLETAHADLAAIAAQLAEDYPDSNRGNSVQVQPLTSFLFRDVRPPMAVLSGAALCVLLIACANVAGLWSVRATVRQREFAIRAALGARRGRLIRLLLTESLLLSLGGALGGFLASFWLVEALKSMLPPETPRLAQVGIDLTVFGFSTAVGVATGILFGLAPGWRASRPDVAEELARSGHSVSPGRQRARALLIAAEYALMVVLLLGSGLMLRTLHQLHQSELGFVRERVLTFSYDLPRYAFADTAARLEAEQRILPRLAALPGVEAVGYSNALPLSRRASFNGFTIEGSGTNSASDLPMADTANVSTGFFTALGVPLLRGRAFTDVDAPGAPRVAIIDAKFAERHFAGQDPLGRRLKIGDAASDLPWMEIVGIVAHIDKYGAGRETGPQLYRPARQAPGAPSFTFALKLAAQIDSSRGADASDPSDAGTVARDPSTLVTSVRAVFRELSPSVPVFDFQTMEERFATSIWSRRLTAVLLTGFAGLAILLALIGLYGVLSYAVAQRTREMGIRLALGAGPRDLLRQVLREGLLLAAVGTALGLAASLGLADALRGLLYGVSPLDLASFIAVPSIALAVGLVASWLPALRATRVNPVEALRAE